MRSAFVRRVLLGILSGLALGGGIPVARHLVHVAVAHAELARLNEARGDEASLEDDPLSPINQARSAKLLESIRQANLAAMASK